MIPALLATGIGCGVAGIYLGWAGAAICASQRIGKTVTCCARAIEERDIWRNRALAAERWLPDEVVIDLRADEVWPA